MSILQIQTARVFKPLLEPSRYKGAYGGRGSGKSHFFAELLVEYCMREPGTRAICIREIQYTLAQSSKLIVEDKIQKLGLGQHFNVLRDRIETPGNGNILFQGMQDHTAESVKGLEGTKIAWMDEGQAISERSLSLLRPTIRVDGSEIWASWNPRHDRDAVDRFFRQLKPADAIVVQANWRDNPWWNATLEAERQLELKLYPDRYAHTYEGDYAQAFEGAYFASCLTEARAQKRITKVAADPLLPLRAVFDLGGSGATADAMAIWIVQFVDQEIRVLDYIEGIGQVLAYYVNELRSRGYQKAICILPHDGVNENNVTGKRYAEHLRDAEFEVLPPVKNQGKGAAMLRVEAVRRIFPKCWFNEPTTKEGLRALGFYHERLDVERKVGLGPDHDWSSHCADAFGLMAICYEDPARTKRFNREIVYPNYGVA